MFRIPVAMFVFNRPRTTARVFAAIALQRPARLFIIADGPRGGVQDDVARCREVREIVAAVDWPCTLSTNMSDVNLGCQERVVSGLDWVFSQVEEAIILEDDCLPDPSFFEFCAQLLERYRGDARVAAISGTNLLEAHVDFDTSYYFSRLGGIWGWATWRSEWRRFDRYLESWPENRRARVLREVFGEADTDAFWTRIFDTMHESVGRSIWDYQWLYTRLISNSVTAVPRVNLVTNIGFGADSTHTSRHDPRLVAQSRAMDFPLRHPRSLVPLASMDRRLQRVHSLPLHERVIRKMIRMTTGKPA